MNAQRAPKLSAFIYVSSDPAELRENKGSGASAGRHDQRSGAGEEHDRVERHGVVQAEPAETVGQPDDQRQPADPSGGRRPDLRAAVLRAGDQRSGLSDAAGHRRRLRRSDRLRTDLAGCSDGPVRAGRRQYDHARPATARATVADARAVAARTRPVRRRRFRRSPRRPPSLFEKAQQAFGAGDFAAYGQYETAAEADADRARRCREADGQSVAITVGEGFSEPQAVGVGFGVRGCHAHAERYAVRPFGLWWCATG